MMSAKLPSLGLPVEEALRDATEELATVSSSNRSGSEREWEKHRNSESKRRVSSKEGKDLLLLLLLLLPSTTMAELNQRLNPGRRTPSRVGREREESDSGKSGE